MENTDLQFIAQELRKANSRIDDLTGQLLGTQAALRALILASSSPSAVGAAVAEEINKLAALALNSVLPDAQVQGIERTKEVVLPRTLELP